MNTAVAPDRISVEASLDGLDEDDRQIAEWILEIVSLAQSGGAEKVPLATLGSRLRILHPEFNHQAYGYSSLLALVFNLSSRTSAFFVDRFSNGHPYVTLVSPSLMADNSGLDQGEA